MSFNTELERVAPARWLAITSPDALASPGCSIIPTILLSPAQSRRPSRPLSPHKRCPPAGDLAAEGQGPGRPTTRWSRPGQRTVRLWCDTCDALAGRLISRPLGA